MANPSRDPGVSPAPVTPRRSRTRRDPSGDEVHRVAAQDFARTVQRLTSAAAASRAPATAPSIVQRSSSLPAPGLVAAPAATPLRALSVPAPTARSMQEAYLAWCTCNNVVLSPGTMAEIDQNQLGDNNP